MFFVFLFWKERLCKRASWFDSHCSTSLIISSVHFLIFACFNSPSWLTSSETTTFPHNIGTSESESTTYPHNIWPRCTNAEMHWNKLLLKKFWLHAALFMGSINWQCLPKNSSGSKDGLMPVCLGKVSSRRVSDIAMQLWWPSCIFSGRCIFTWVLFRINLIPQSFDLWKWKWTDKKI